MFTGIVEQLGTVASLQRSGDGLQLEVRAAGLDLGEGESLAVDGTCLTAIRPRPGRFTAVLSPETLGRTTLAALREGDRVNLERALAVGGRMGGHFVLGHVDTVGHILAVMPEGGGARLVVGLARRYDSLIVEKGSLAVNGVSLTIAARRRGQFEVALIPHTLTATNLGSLVAGVAVNLELDYLAKLVAGLLASRRSGRGGPAAPAPSSRRIKHAARKH